MRGSACAGRVGSWCVFGCARFGVAGVLRVSHAGLLRLTIVLAGMALTSIFTAGMNTILIFNPDAYVNSSGFLVGSLSGVTASELVIPGCAICVGLLVDAGQGTRLNILSLGDEGAHALGLNVQRTRLILLSLAASLAGAAVSFAGLIGFVGLVVSYRPLLRRP